MYQRRRESSVTAWMSFWVCCKQRMGSQPKRRHFSSESRKSGVDLADGKSGGLGGRTPNKFLPCVYRAELALRKEHSLRLRSLTGVRSIRETDKEKV